MVAVVRQGSLCCSFLMRVNILFGYQCVEIVVSVHIEICCGAKHSLLVNRRRTDSFVVLGTCEIIATCTMPIMHVLLTLSAR